MLARRVIRLNLLALAAALALACQTTEPDLQPIQGADFEPTIAEQELWRAASDYHEGLEEAGLIVEDEELDAYLQSHLENLMRAGDLPEDSARIVVVKDPYMNASMLANGTLYVHSGMLARMHNEAQLVTLLGHEVAHFKFRHSLKQTLYEEQQRTNRILNRVGVGILLLPIGLSAVVFDDLKDESLKAIVAPQVAGYSRELEVEADRYAFETMTERGYAPAEAARLFQLLAIEAKLLEEEINLSNGYQVRDPYYYASHPDLVDRTRFLNRLHAERQNLCWGAPDAKPEECDHDTGEVGTDRYMSRIASVAREIAGLDSKAGRRRGAARVLERLVAFDPEAAESWAMLGSVRSARGWDDARRDEAVDAFERAIALDPELASAHRELGLLFRAMGRNESAARSLQRYIDSAPEAPDRAIVEHIIGDLR